MATGDLQSIPSDSGRYSTQNQHHHHYHVIAGHRA
jgi:hypothetical protein